MKTLEEIQKLMSTCHVCGSTQFRDELTSEVFEVEGKHILVERIPAKVCARCGEVTFSRETTERIRRMVHGEGKPMKSVSMDVFAYGAE